jgi:hypothetical protein
VTGSRGRVGDVLVSTLLEPGTPRREALGDLVRGQDLTSLPALASAHRVSNAAYRALSGLDGVDPSVLSLLEREYQASLRRHLRALVDLGAVAEIMTSRGFPWLAVKGPVVSERLYGPDNHRNYADLDVLVPRGEFQAVVESCVDRGLAVVQTDWGVAVRELAGEVCLILPSGTAMDLHWDLLYHERTRRSFAFDVQEMFDRRVDVDLTGTAVPTLDPADTLLHLALHAAKGGGVRLQWLKDIERAVSVGQPDWDAVVTRSRRWGLTLVAGVMLDRARRVLDAPVPDEVGHALGGRPWRQVVRAADRIRPVERTVGRHAISTMVARATGPSGWSSLRLLAQQARISLRSPATGQPAYEVRRGRDPALDAFLHAVSNGRRAAREGGLAAPIGDQR